MRTKYIIVDTGLPTAFIFPETVTHADVARAVAPGRPVLGAGFVSVSDDGEYSCWGESISLKIKSREAEDTRILNHTCRGRYD
jgi:hypothetical protein